MGGIKGWIAENVLGQELLQEGAVNKKNLEQALNVWGLELLPDGHISFSGDPSSNESIMDRLISQGHGLEKGEAGFMAFWMKYGFNTDTRNEQGRKKRYDDYEFMLNDSPETSLFFDTLVSEMLSYRLVTGNLVNIRVTDRETGKEAKDLSKYANDRINEMDLKNKVIAEGMVQYGNQFIASDIVDAKVVLKSYYKNPIDVRILINPLGDFVGYEIDTGTTVTANKDNKKLPYQVINFDIATSDRRFIPYGKSMFEALRSSYKKLMILESLLAISRASKSDKLVVKFPAGSMTSVTDSFNQAVKMRGMIKNLIYGSGVGQKTANKPFAFMEILLAPKDREGNGVDFDRLPSGIDLATIEDIEYFWDKLIAGTRMPRAFFKPDEAYQGYRKLAQQDLRFSRVVVSLFENFSRGAITLSKLILAVEKEMDVNRYKVEAEYRNITPISTEQLDGIQRGLDTVSSMVSSIRDNVGLETLSLDVIKAMMVQFTNLPDDFIDSIFKKIKKDQKAAEEPEPEGEEVNQEEAKLIVESVKKVMSEMKFLDYSQTVYNDGDNFKVMYESYKNQTEALVEMNKGKPYEERLVRAKK